MTRMTLAFAILGLTVGCASRAAPVDAWSVATPAPFVARELAEETGPPANEDPDEVEFKRHSLAIITRYVTEERADGGVALGLEYVYRFHEHWGTAAYVEYVAGEIDAVVLGATLNFRPIEPWGIALGPGYELSEDHPRWILRLGTFYEFEVGTFTITPAAYVDWLEGGGFAVLAGLNFGIRF